MVRCVCIGDKVVVIIIVIVLFRIIGESASSICDVPAVGVLRS